MSNRDRASRAKDSAAGADENLDDLGGVNDDELRPSGKRASRGKRSTATLEREADAGVATTGKKKPAAESRNPFVRIWLFLTQVVGELKKVIWPTRREMIQYTVVVLIFVIVVTALIAGLDVGFAKLVLWILG